MHHQGGIRRRAVCNGRELRDSATKWRDGELQQKAKEATRDKDSLLDRLIGSLKMLQHINPGLREWLAKHIIKRSQQLIGRGIAVEVH